MDPKLESTTPTAEELAAEQAAAQIPKAEEVRAAIISEYGFDETNDGEKIDKLVAKELEHKTKLSQAIGQKIKHRNEADQLRTKVNPTPTPTLPAKTEDPAKMAEDAVSKALAQRDLDDMEYPENIKDEIKRVAQITGKSVKQAAKDPYIVSTLIEPWQKDQKVAEAAISRTNRQSGKVEVSMDQDPPEIDSSSPEAFEKSNKAYEEWKQKMIREGY